MTVAPPNPHGVLGTYDVCPFQAVYAKRLGEGDSMHAMCYRVGWIRPDGRSDQTRLLRILGIRATAGKDRGHKTRIQYHTAVELCRALNIDPVDMGV